MTERKSVVSKVQPSLSEWFAAIGHADAEALRQEDMHKRDRLEILRRRIGLDYDRVTAWSAQDFFSRAPDVQAFIDKRGEELCALRLVPTAPNLPKLRTRGRTLNESLPWLEEQEISNVDDYKVEFVEHNGGDIAWSTIFVVREDGIFGTIVDGLHFQLTQGNVEDGRVSRAFQIQPDGSWWWSDYVEGAQEHMKEILEQIHVVDPEVQAQLKEQLDSEFTSEGYLIGYFETLLWPTKLIFIDYNRKLHKVLRPPSNIGGVPHTPHDSEPIVKGIPASPGEARGVVRLVSEDAIDTVTFNDGDILVTDNTDVRYLPLMRRAGAIVTDRGGMLSHAAITAREMKVPCVVGCGEATEILEDGQGVVVDAVRGVVFEVKNQKVYM